MKKKYSAPKAINAGEKIYPAVLNGLVWFALRALMKGNSSFDKEVGANVKVLQTER